MIFTGFKRKSNQIFFNKQIPILLNNSHENSSEKVNKVLVFTDDISKKNVILSGLKELFGSSEMEVEILVFKQKVSKENAVEGVFYPKDFGWYGKVKSEKLTKILTNKYDLLINYSKVENIYSNMLLLQSKTAFRVGFGHLDNRFYDLIIKCDPSDIALFNKELKKYLAILNKI